MWKNSDLDACSLVELVEMAFTYRLVSSIDWTPEGLAIRLSPRHTAPVMSPADAQVFLASCLCSVPAHERTGWVPGRILRSELRQTAAALSHEALRRALPQRPDQPAPGTLGESATAMLRTKVNRFVPQEVPLLAERTLAQMEQHYRGMLATLYVLHGDVAHAMRAEVEQALSLVAAERSHRRGAALPPPATA